MNISLTGGYVIDGSTDATFEGVWATIPTPASPNPVPALSAWGSLVAIALLATLGALVPPLRRAVAVD